MPQEQIHRVKAFFTVHSDARVRDVSKQLNIGFGTVWKTVQLFLCFSRANIGANSEYLFDTADLSLCPANILPVGCPGFREPASSAGSLKSQR